MRRDRSMAFVFTFFFLERLWVASHMEGARRELGDSTDMCDEKSLAFTDWGVRTPIGVSGNGGMEVKRKRKLNISAVNMN